MIRLNERGVTTILAFQSLNIYNNTLFFRFISYINSKELLLQRPVWDGALIETNTCFSLFFVSWIILAI